MSRQVLLQGVAVGSRQTQQAFIRALDAGGIHPIVDRRFAFSELAEAFRFERAGGHFGKIGVVW